MSRKTSVAEESEVKENFRVSLIQSQALMKYRKTEKIQLPLIKTLKKRVQKNPKNASHPQCFNQILNLLIHKKNQYKIRQIESKNKKDTRNMPFLQRNLSLNAQLLSDPSRSNLTNSELLKETGAILPESRMTDIMNQMSSPQEKMEEDEVALVRDLPQFMQSNHSQVTHKKLFAYKVKKRDDHFNTLKKFEKTLVLCEERIDHTLEKILKRSVQRVKKQRENCTFFIENLSLQAHSEWPVQNLKDFRDSVLTKFKDLSFFCLSDSKRKLKDFEEEVDSHMHDVVDRMRDIGFVLEDDLKAIHLQYQERQMFYQIKMKEKSERNIEMYHQSSEEVVKSFDQKIFIWLHLWKYNSIVKEFQEFWGFLSDAKVRDSPSFKEQVLQLQNSIRRMGELAMLEIEKFFKKRLGNLQGGDLSQEDYQDLLIAIDEKLDWCEEEIERNILSFKQMIQDVIGLIDRRFAKFEARLDYLEYEIDKELHEDIVQVRGQDEDSPEDQVQGADRRSEASVKKSFDAQGNLIVNKKLEHEIIENNSSFLTKHVPSDMQQKSVKSLNSIMTQKSTRVDSEIYSFLEEDLLDILINRSPYLQNDIIDTIEILIRNVRLSKYFDLHEIRSQVQRLKDFYLNFEAKACEEISNILLNRRLNLRIFSEIFNKFVTLSQQMVDVAKEVSGQSMLCKAYMEDENLEKVEDLEDKLFHASSLLVKSESEESLLANLKVCEDLIDQLCSEFNRFKTGLNDLIEDRMVPEVRLINLVRMRLLELNGSGQVSSIHNLLEEKHVQYSKQEQKKETPKAKSLKKKQKSGKFDKIENDEIAKLSNELASCLSKFASEQEESNKVFNFDFKCLFEKIKKKVDGFIDIKKDLVFFHEHLVRNVKTFKHQSQEQLQKYIYQRIKSLETIETKTDKEDTMATEEVEELVQVFDSKSLITLLNYDLKKFDKDRLISSGILIVDLPKIQKKVEIKRNKSDVKRISQLQKSDISILDTEETNINSSDKYGTHLHTKESKSNSLSMRNKEIFIERVFMKVKEVYADKLAEKDLDLLNLDFLEDLMDMDIFSKDKVINSQFEGIFGVVSYLLKQQYTLKTFGEESCCLSYPTSIQMPEYQAHSVFVPEPKAKPEPEPEEPPENFNLKYKTSKKKKHKSKINRIMDEPMKKKEPKKSPKNKEEEPPSETPEKSESQKEPEVVEKTQEKEVKVESELPIKKEPNPFEIVLKYKSKKESVKGLDKHIITDPQSLFIFLHKIREQEASFQEAQQPISKISLFETRFCLQVFESIQRMFGEYFQDKMGQRLHSVISGVNKLRLGSDKLLGHRMAKISEVESKIKNKSFLMRKEQLKNQTKIFQIKQNRFSDDIKSEAREFQKLQQQILELFEEISRETARFESQVALLKDSKANVRFFMNLTEEAKNYFESVQQKGASLLKSLKQTGHPKIREHFDRFKNEIKHFPGSHPKLNISRSQMKIFIRELKEKSLFCNDLIKSNRGIHSEFNKKFKAKFSECRDKINILIEDTNEDIEAENSSGNRFGRPKLRISNFLSNECLLIESSQQNLLQLGNQLVEYARKVQEKDDIRFTKISGNLNKTRAFPTNPNSKSVSTNPSTKQMMTHTSSKKTRFFKSTMTTKSSKYNSKKIKFIGNINNKSTQIELVNLDLQKEKGEFGGIEKKYPNPNLRFDLNSAPTTENSFELFDREFKLEHLDRYTVHMACLNTYEIKNILVQISVGYHLYANYLGYFSKQENYKMHLNILNPTGEKLKPEFFDLKSIPSELRVNIEGMGMESEELEKEESEKPKKPNPAQTDRDVSFGAKKSASLKKSKNSIKSSNLTNKIPMFQTIGKNLGRTVAEEEFQLLREKVSSFLLYLESFYLDNPHADITLIQKQKLLKNILIQEVKVLYNGRHVNLLNSKSQLTPILEKAYNQMKENFDIYLKKCLKDLVESLILFGGQTRHIISYLFRNLFNNFLIKIIKLKNEMELNLKILDRKITSQYDWFKKNFKHSYLHEENKEQLDSFRETIDQWNSSFIRDLKEHQSTSFEIFAALFVETTRSCLSLFVFLITFLSSFLTVHDLKHLDNEHLLNKKKLDIKKIYIFHKKKQKNPHVDLNNPKNLKKKFSSVNLLGLPWISEMEKDLLISAVANDTKELFLKQISKNKGGKKEKAKVKVESIDPGASSNKYPVAIDQPNDDQLFLTIQSFQNKNNSLVLQFTNQMIEALKKVYWFHKDQKERAYFDLNLSFEKLVGYIDKTFK